MKKFAYLAIAAASLMASGAFAQTTATGNFNVVINLTSKCEINSTTTSPATIADLTMDYTSYQTTAATGSTNFNVRCTRDLPYSIALDQTLQLDSSLRLLYTLGLSTSAIHDPARVSTLPGLVADGNNQTYYVHGTIPANESGACATATCDNSAATNRRRTITVSY
jgi:spore coat protein U-like protein